MHSKCLAAVVLLCWATLVRVQGQQCDTQKTSGVAASVSSVRNRTGHWVTKVCLRQNTESAASSDVETVPWSVDVEPRSSTCVGAKSTLDVTITFTAPPPRAAGYELIPGLGYYKFHVEVESWTRARAVCDGEGGHLMIVNSDKEAEVIKHLYARYPAVIPGSSDNGYGWVGIYRPVASVGWITVFGQPMNETGYARWIPTLPTKNAGYDFMLARRSDALYHDQPDDRKYPYICEQELF